MHTLRLAWLLLPLGLMACEQQLDRDREITEQGVEAGDRYGADRYLYEEQTGAYEQEAEHEAAERYRMGERQVGGDEAAQRGFGQDQAGEPTTERQFGVQEGEQLDRQPYGVEPEDEADLQQDPLGQQDPPGRQDQPGQQDPLGLQDQKQAKGTVQAIDYDKGEIVLNTEDQGQLTLRATPQDLASLQQGRTVDVQWAEYQGTPWLAPQGMDQQEAERVLGYSKKGTVTGTVDQLDPAQGSVTIRGHEFQAHPRLLEQLVPGQIVELSFVTIGENEWLTEESGSQPGQTTPG